MTIPKDWPAFLVTSSLSEQMVSALRRHLPPEQFAAFEPNIWDTESRAVELQALATTLRPALPGALLNDLMWEVREIRKDQRWLTSNRGRYILALNRWAEPFFEEFRSFPEFSDVMIGGHAQREVVFVTGAVANQIDLDRLLEYVGSKDPPYKVLTKLKIINQTEPS